MEYVYAVKTGEVQSVSSGVGSVTNAVMGVMGQLPLSVETVRSMLI